MADALLCWEVKRRSIRERRKEHGESRGDDEREIILRQTGRQKWALAKAEKRTG